MKQCGDLTARVTVILSWNISGKSGRSWLLVRFTVILIQFGGVVIGGTSEKYGIKENFSRPICFLCFGGSPDVRLSLYDMQFNQQQLSLRWNRNFSRRFNRLKWKPPQRPSKIYCPCLESFKLCPALFSLWAGWLYPAYYIIISN